MTDGGQFNDDELDEFDLPVVGGGLPAMGDGGAPAPMPVVPTPGTPTPQVPVAPVEQAQSFDNEGTFVMSHAEIAQAGQAAQQAFSAELSVGEPAPPSFDGGTTDLMLGDDAPPPSSSIPDSAMTMNYGGPPPIQTDLHAGALSFRGLMTATLAARPSSTSSSAPSSWRRACATG